MRLWTLHPRYLDPPGLVALWREALLARQVLRGRTKGYRHHPQLARFRATDDPVGGIERYLAAVHQEAASRGYRFDASKLGRRAVAAGASRDDGRVPASRGQLLLEWRHLKRKLRARSPGLYRRLRRIRSPQAHPLFRIVPGGPAAWERARPGGRTLAAARRLLPALVLLSALAWCGSTRPRAVEVPVPGRDVVVLLHGLSRSPRSMKKLETALAGDGYEVVNFGYAAGRRPIEALSGDLETRLAVYRQDDSADSQIPAGGVLRSPATRPSEGGRGARSWHAPQASWS